MTSTDLWLINTLINLSEIACLFGILLAGVVGVFTCIVIASIVDYKYEWTDDEGKFAKKWLSIGWSVVVALLIFSAAIPNRKELAVIYVLPKVVNNERIQQIPDKAIEKILEYLEVGENDKNSKTGKD